MHGARRPGREWENHPCPTSLRPSGSCGKPYKKMLRRPPCVEEGIGGRENDRSPAEEDELGPQMEPRIGRLLGGEVPRRYGGRTGLIALRRFLAQKLLSRCRKVDDSGPGHVQNLCRTDPPDPAAGPRMGVAVQHEPWDVGANPLAQPVEALVRAVARLVVDPGGRRVADEHVGGREPACKPRRLLLRVLVRPVAVADATLEARERHAVELDPPQMQVLIPSAAITPSWLP